MYRHPDVQYTELGFGGRDGLLVVWLFGREWTTRQFVLSSLQWYMMCLTWMHKREKPLLYINGFPIDITEGGSGNTPPSLTSSMTIILLPFSGFSPSSLPQHHSISTNLVLQTGSQRDADSGCHAPAGGWQHSGRSSFQYAGKTLSLSTLGARTEQRGSDVTEVHGGRHCDVVDGPLGRWGLPCHLGSNPALR